MYKQLVETAIKAGQATLEYYNADYEITIKDDDSPVTQADLAAHDIICDDLQKFFADVPILSEEDKSSEESCLKLLKSEKLFIIDPIDGTSAFIDKKPEFTINIAYIEGGKFKYGVIYVPRIDALYYNDDENSYKIEQAYKNPKEITLEKVAKNKNNKDSQIILTSHRPKEIALIDQDIENMNIKVEKFLRFSSSYKFCLIADGSADVYFRRGNVKVWDIAAAMSILEKSGSAVYDFDGNKIGFEDLSGSLEVPHFYVKSQKS